MFTTLINISFYDADEKLYTNMVYLQMETTHFL